MKTPLLCLFLTIGHLSIHAQTPDSVAVAAAVDSLIKYNRTLVGEGRFEEALKGMEEAAQQAEKAFGKEHRLYASCRYNQGRTYQIWRRNSEAIPFLLEAKAIRERIIGKENLDYANTLQQLGVVHLRTDKLSEAKKFYLEARDIREKILGKEHEDYVNSTVGLAATYGALREFEQSLLLFHEALSIFEKTIGKKNVNYIFTAMDLAMNYIRMSQYEQAENIYLEILKISSGLNNYNKIFAYAGATRGLSDIYFELGQYEQAEKYLTESIAIQENGIGEYNPYLLIDKTFLGVIKSKLGRRKEGKNLVLDAMHHIEKVEGKSSRNYYQAMINASMISQNDTILYQILESTFEQLKPENRAASWINIHNLAIYYALHRKLEKAEALFKESIQYQEKAFGPNHVSITRSWMHLGNVYRLEGRFEEAERVLLKARNIWRQYFKPQHDDFIFNEHTLAWLYAQWGREEQADTAFAEIGRLRRELALRGARYLSESELGRYVQAYLNQNDQLCYRAAKRTGRDAVLTGEVWNNALFYKGLLLDNRNLLQRMIVAAPDSIRSLHDQWRGYLRRLNVAYTQASSPDATRIDTLEHKANAIEKTLTQALAGFEQMNRQVTWQEVRQSLRANEAAVEFVHYRSFAPTGKGVDSTFYAALLLRPGYEHPRWIGLFEERQLDSLLLTAGKRRADYVNHLYDFADRGLKPLGSPRKMLYELVWQPLEPFLTGVDTVYFSLSGLLHRINLPAIACSPDSVVADRYKLTGLGSTRRLTRLPETPEPASNYAVLFGGIRYEADTTAILSANAELDSVSYSARGLLDFGYTDSTLRSDAWSYLPFAEKEVRAIEILLKNANIHAETRKGFAATEESFKTLGQGKTSPRILHVATHGFFFPDPKIPNRLRDAVETESTFKLSDHPMIRSGLLMAGANGAWQNGQPLKPGLEDGILTAYEISQMNLSNTELVVLSACETGLGDIQGNEGVYGLQRAFKIAGAKYLIMSLWQVPDQETSIFMTSFYRHWLEGKMTIPDAFRTTWREMRERFINPYQWAGFVLVE